MRVFYALFVLILLGGCSTTHPSVTEFRIQTQVAKHDTSSKECSQKSLKVAQTFSPASLMSLDMSYAVGGNKQFLYTQSQWSMPPNKAVSAEVLKHIREHKLFKNVQVSQSRSTSDLVLETNIEDFMQYFNADKTESYANVVVSFSLIDFKSAKVLDTQTFSSKIKVKSLDAQGGTQALNEALTDIIAQSVIWLDGICK